MLRHKEDLELAIKTLRDAPRLHAAGSENPDEDVPEGSRYIQISDTLAKQIVEGLCYLSRSLFCED